MTILWVKSRFKTALLANFVTEQGLFTRMKNILFTMLQGKVLPLLHVDCLLNSCISWKHRYIDNLPVLKSFKSGEIFNTLSFWSSVQFSSVTGCRSCGLFAQVFYCRYLFGLVRRGVDKSVKSFCRLLII